MNYRIRKNQIFRKKLPIPKDVMEKVYKNTLTFEEYIEYNLEDKVPIDCLAPRDRLLVEKFGVERVKNLDWELITTRFSSTKIDIRKTLESLPPETPDINKVLYETIIPFADPSDYSDKMRKAHPEAFFEIDYSEDDQFRQIKKAYNNRHLTLSNMVYYWDEIKDKNLSLCLQNDPENIHGITEEALRNFMDNYGTLANLIRKKDNIYNFIHNLDERKTDEERHELLKNFAEKVLEETKKEFRDERKMHLSNEEYEVLFEYASLEDYLMYHHHSYASTICRELESLPKGYIFHQNIPFEVFAEWDVMAFVGIYGIKNVVDFDNECGHFFSKDNFKMLRLMNDMYLHYAGNEHNPERHIDTKYIFEPQPEDLDEYLERPERGYTKEEFYEAMRRMILYGPSDSSYLSHAPDYRTMVGEFRVRNSTLFIDKTSPQELQELFYQKRLTRKHLIEHPEYIPYLEGKDMNSCFIRQEIQIEDSKYFYGYHNLYAFLSDKMTYPQFISYITEYDESLDILLTRENSMSHYELKFHNDDTYEDIIEKTNKTLRLNIIEKGLPYPTNIPPALKTQYPSMFLGEDAPLELQEKYYKREITTEYILEHPEYIDTLKQVELESVFKCMSISTGTRYNPKYTNIITIFEEQFKSEAFDTLLVYGKYIEKSYDIDKLQDVKYRHNYTPDMLLDELDSKFAKQIRTGKLYYDETMPTHFKQNYPEYFVYENIPEEIKRKFYNKELTITDFIENEKLIEDFGITNIACGFPPECSWIISLFNGNENHTLANYNRLKVLNSYMQIEDNMLQQAFREYILEFGDNIDISKVEFISSVLERLALSNSSEIYTFRQQLATQILKSENPLETLTKIEEVFTRSNIPTVGKIFSCVQILHPNFDGFDFSSSKVSPVLKNTSTRGRNIVAFADLIKCSFGSANRSALEYLETIEEGYNLYLSIKENNKSLDSLTDKEQKHLEKFASYLTALYNNTQEGKKEGKSYSQTNNPYADIASLEKLLSPNGKDDYNLADRVVHMFCGFVGIDTLELAKKYMTTKVAAADAKNRKTAESNFVIQQGDYVKGIGNIIYLRNILQNGSVSKEYLGTSSTSDATPLDTDVSKVLIDPTSPGQAIKSTQAAGYGPIYFVLKNDDRFITTRTAEGPTGQKNNLTKLEAFYTGHLGEGHYGIRTGFASSEIDCIIMETFDQRVGLEIAMNGFYIPVADMTGKIVFTPSDYEILREKMSGLSYYGETEYKFSNTLITPDTKEIAQEVSRNNEETRRKREKIDSIIASALEEVGLKLKTELDGDLTEGYVELIDTGSTARGTNKIGEGDFDFMVRLDRTILSNPTKLAKVKEALLRSLGQEDANEIGTGDYRLKGVDIGEDTQVEIDLTFTTRTDSVTYSTDMALADRLETIKSTDPEKYEYVVANILLAKQVLKEAGVYKPDRGETPQGGLGGVGVENWILQNGGSFLDAATSFVEAAKGKSFDEFKSTYQIWDFGDNHLAERRGNYVHDNFVANNMSEAGYHKMVETLTGYLKSHNLEQTNQNKHQI